MSTEAKKETKSRRKGPKGKLITRVLNFKLTEHEKSEKGQEAAKLQAEHDELLVKKKIKTDELSAQIKDRGSRMKTLLTQINTGTEQRKTECTEVKNFDTKKVEYWVGKEKVEERDMTEEDKQLELAPQPSVAAKKAARIRRAVEAVQTPKKPNPLRGGRRQKVDQGVASVIASETNRKTKHSPVDGARA